MRLRWNSLTRKNAIGSRSGVLPPAHRAVEPKADCPQSLSLQLVRPLKPAAGLEPAMLARARRAGAGAGEATAGRSAAPAATKASR